MFDQDTDDPIGRFGQFADAFDVSTAMPLVVYLATEGQLGNDLDPALAALESYILRRDICGLTTKNYNRFFVGMIDRLRQADGNKLESLISYLSGRKSDIDVWPDDATWRNSWIGRSQYKSARKPRIRYILEAIERKKRTRLSESIEIKSALSVEHILPQKWQQNWPVSGSVPNENDPLDLEYIELVSKRNAAIDVLGNLTLLTHSLNSSISNGPFSVKMPAVRAHASLAINRDLTDYDRWDEETIARRGSTLFDLARAIWIAPLSPMPTS